MQANVIVVMGVSGCGKSTVGEQLAGRLGWSFAEADTFHSNRSVEKMRAGIPLTDEDRGPWLDAMAGWIALERSAGRKCIVTCSALKRAYRERLRAGRDDVAFVHLAGGYDLIAGRVATRRHEYMPASLLKSQFETLEAPTAGEALTLSIEAPPEELVEQVVARLGL
jgi:gluconokinase